MARKATAPTPPTSYEMLARRIQKQILAPRAQLERQTVIVRAAEELESDWDLLLEQLGEEESVTIRPGEDGAIHLTWTAPRAD